MDPEQVRSCVPRREAEATTAFECNSDRVTHSKRLQLFAHQARFLMIKFTWDPNLAPAVSTLELPGQWRESLSRRVLLAETFANPESHAGNGYKASGWEPIGLSRWDGRHHTQKLPEPLGFRKL